MLLEILLDHFLITVALRLKLVKLVFEYGLSTDLCLFVFVYMFGAGAN